MLHLMSYADREMFAYNAARAKQKAELDRVLAQPEQRIKFCFEFLSHADEGMSKKCYDGIAKYSELLDWSEAHY